MSTGELVGLLFTVSLLAILLGAVAAAALATHRNRVAVGRQRRVDAYAEWLAAYLTTTRAAVSFVAAFRALAVVKRDSEYFSLRQDEAQRARTAWCDATRELDRAEAVLTTRSTDPSIRGQLARFDPISPERLRVAIDGPRGEVARLIQRLRETDEQAAEFVRSATAQTPARDSRVGRQLARVRAYVARIVDSWCRAGDATQKRKSL